MRRHLLCTVSAVALGAGPVQAAEPFDWDGPYIGGTAGLAILDGTISATGGLPPTSDGLGDVGITAGGLAGWNFRHGDFVFGSEGDFSFLDLDDDLDHFTGKRTVNLRADYDWFASVRARAGMLVAPSILIYGTAGIAFTESDLKLVNGAISTATDSDLLVGLAAGVGIEYAFSGALTARAEYLYANFEKHGIGPVPGGFNLSGSAEPEFHLVRVGVTWHFCTGGMC